MQTIRILTTVSLNLKNSQYLEVKIPTVMELAMTFNAYINFFRILLASNYGKGVE
jgi:hypothetical protein